jgi:membrane protein DedA with SNARE-associated domain
MIASILSWLATLVIKVISGSGYLGITGLMALESACVPIPSEIVMPFAGYLVTAGQFSLLWVIIFGAIGNLIGSIIAYWVGVYGGRPFIGKYGKYLLIKKEELDKADKFFTKYGSLSVFFSRLLPIVRTFISLPAGIAKMPFWKFSFYTFIGSLFWSAVLAYIGVFLGSNWQNIEIYFREFDWLIGILLLVGIIYFIYKKISAQGRSTSGGKN